MDAVGASVARGTVSSLSCVSVRRLYTSLAPARPARPAAPPWLPAPNLRINSARHMPSMGDTKRLLAPALVALCALLESTVPVSAQLPAIPPAPSRVPAECANINALFDIVDGLHSICGEDTCTVACAAASLPLVERCGDVLRQNVPERTMSAVQAVHDACAATITAVSRAFTHSLPERCRVRGPRYMSSRCACGVAD